MVARLVAKFLVKVLAEVGELTHEEPVDLTHVSLDTPNFDLMDQPYVPFGFGR